MLEFKRLKAWEIALNSCIRCGYCYEHCPIYRATGWESDAPRGKLIILHGLLHRRIGLTTDTGSKVFQCLGCGQCEKACSSGVPLLDIFQDARADIMDTGIEVKGTLAETDPQKCVACLNCLRVCPHEARYFQDGIVLTDPVKCRGCGSCVDTCSAGAIKFETALAADRGLIEDQIREFVENHKNDKKLVVFSCNWSTYPGLQHARFSAQENAEKEREPYKLFVTACAGRLPMELPLKALELGAHGVLVVHCPSDQCDHEGADRAKARITRLRNFLSQAGMDPERVRTAEAPRLDTKAFSSAVSDFLRYLGSPGKKAATGDSV
ncbi:MAG: hydrogenase iron-sulfur subunit [Deltaproteobacteria bacterium]|nr:hydrogenase iron-sulfur subunit [Deltaproteobacteria bacterium]